MNTTLWYIPQRRSWVKPPAVTRELLKLNPAGTASCSGPLHTLG